MNETTKLFHGLKASKSLVQLLKSYVDAGSVRLSEIEIELDNGELLKFTPEQYIALANESLDKSIQIIRDQTSGGLGRQ